MSAPIPLKDVQHHDRPFDTIKSDYDALAFALEPSRRHLEDISTQLREIAENTLSLFKVIPILETKTCTAGAANGAGGTPIQLSYRNHFNCMLFSPYATAALFIAPPDMAGFTRTLSNPGWYIINLPDGTNIYAATGGGPFTFHLRYDNIVWGTSL